MKRIKSAPANIAEMVNRKKINNLQDNKNSENNKILYFIINKNQNQQEKEVIAKKLNFFVSVDKKENQQLILKEKLKPLKNQKNIEKTFNSLMLDYINDKQIININHQESFLATIIYYYISEKIFTKNNLTEFTLFIVQLLVRYIITHTFHETIINNKELIDLLPSISITHHI